MPYWSLYLKSLGLDPRQIGMLAGAVMATKIVAPSIWGWLADHSGRRLSVIRIGSFLAFACFSALYFSQSFSWLLFVVLGYSFFWNAVLAQFEVLTLSHLDNEHNRYSQIRLWGSIGFITAVLLLGILFDFVSIGYLPIVLAGFLLGIWLCSLWVPDSMPRPAQPNNAGLLDILRRPSVLAFLSACCLLQIAHGPYNTFFSLYLDYYGFNRTLIGQLWALGVLAEVVLFIFMHRLLPFFDVRKLILLSLLLSVIRWLIIAYGVESMPLLIVGQLMHAATFGAFHAAAIELVRRAFPSHLAGQGQAVYSGLSFGLGGAMGAVLSGMIWEYSATLTFVMASLASLIALLIAWIWIKDEQLVECPIL